MMVWGSTVEHDKNSAMCNGLENDLLPKLIAFRHVMAVIK